MVHNNEYVVSANTGKYRPLVRAISIVNKMLYFSVITRSSLTETYLQTPRSCGWWVVILNKTMDKFGRQRDNISPEGLYWVSHGFCESLLHKTHIPVTHRVFHIYGHSHDRSSSRWTWLVCCRTKVQQSWEWWGAGSPLTSHHCYWWSWVGVRGRLGWPYWRRYELSCHSI